MGEATSQIQLVSAEVCPFAQRSRLVLLEKKLSFELVEINLDNKPDWFTNISPYSKVPVLLHGDTAIYESTVINEYLDEIAPEPNLLPKSPQQRAHARIWIDFDNSRIVPIFYKFMLCFRGYRHQIRLQAAIGSILPGCLLRCRGKTMHTVWLPDEIIKMHPVILNKGLVTNR